MDHVLRGFLKEAGALSVAKGLGKTVMKHPMLALTAPMVVGGTVMSAREAYKRGRAGGEGERYLPAAFDPVSGRAMASRAAYTNYNPLFKRKPSAKEIKQLHKYYKEEAFKYA